MKNVYLIEKERVGEKDILKRIRIQGYKGEISLSNNVIQIQ